ncbi:MAG: O-antigen ligase family protein [Chloroflexota bacterium]|nr:O-antigen ligase family protein [Chloroflexota bacterium]
MFGDRRYGPQEILHSALVTLTTLLSAIAVSIGTSATDLPYLSIVTPGAAALLIAIAFAKWPAEGIGSFLLFSLLAISVEVVSGADLRYFDEIGLLLLLFVGVVRHRVPGGRLHLGVAEIAMCVVVGSGVLSSLVEAVPLDIWLLGLLLLLKGVAFYYLVSWLRLTMADVERVAIVVVGVALVILILGFLEFRDPAAFQRAFGLPPYDEVRGGIRVIKSIFTHPSLFGWFTAFASLILYARFLVTRIWWLLPLALLLDVGTLLSGRRTPIVGLVVALAVGLIWQWRHSRGARMVLRSWVPLTAAAVVLVVVFMPLWSGIVRETLRDYGNSRGAIAEILEENPDPEVVSAVAQRTALYVASVAIARDEFPLGGGLGRFGSFMSRIHYSPLYEAYGLTGIYGLSPASRMALNDTFWPSVLGETGIIGLIAFGTFIGTLFHRLWRASGLEDSPAWRAFVLAAILVFVDRFVGSLTAMTYVAAPIAYFTFATVGAVLAVAATKRAPPHRLPGLRAPGA